MNEKKALNIKIAWFVFVLSDVFYTAIIIMIEKGIFKFETERLITPETSRYLSYAVGVLVLFVIVLRRFFYFPSDIVNKTLEQAKERWFKLDIVVFSIGESIGVIGLIYYLLSFDYKMSIFLMVISFLVLVLSYPFEMKQMMREEQYQRMRKEAGIYER